MQVGRRSKYKASPSLANVDEFVPPLFMDPIHPSCDITLVFVKDGHSIEIKGVKE
jgi:hypothetical protein